MDTTATSPAVVRAPALRPAQREVLQLFVRFGPMEDAALVPCAFHAGLTQSVSSLRTRRAELVRLGYLYDTGRRVIGDRGSRRPRIVWALVPGAADA